MPHNRIFGGSFEDQVKALITDDKKWREPKEKPINIGEIGEEAEEFKKWVEAIKSFDNEEERGGFIRAFRKVVKDYLQAYEGDERYQCYSLSSWNLIEEDTRGLQALEIRMIETSRLELAEKINRDRGRG